MSSQKTLKDLNSTTSLQESEAGQQLSELQAGQTTDLFAQHHCHASHLAQQETTKEKKMSDTCCHTSCDSLGSATLTPSWVSRLKQQLGMGGSMIYKQTWKQKATPQGLLYWAHTASTPRTKGSDFIGWPTATTRDYKDTGDLSKSMIRKDGRSRCDSLARVAYGLVAPWATPQASDWKNKSSSRDSTLSNYKKGYYPHGAIPETYIVGTTSSVPYPLNPRFSLWLMGYPIEWAYSGERVTLSSPRLRQK